MTGATLIRWGAGIPGREAKGLEVFGNAVAYFEDLTKKGQIHGHREYFSLTGGSGGFMLIEGDVAELTKLLYTPEILELNLQAESIVSDFEITVYGGGSDAAVQELMGTYTNAIAKLGYL